MASHKQLEVDSYQQQQQWRPPPMVGVEVPPPTPQTPYLNLHLPRQPPSTVEVCVSSSRKSLFEAYLLGFTLGLLGAHHFYLRRTWFGVAYVLTMGLFGVGYLVDLFRMPCLVREANMALTEPALRDRKSKCDAYLLWFPCGLLGLHYFYLRKPAFGALYFFTFGLCGIGWLVDGVRMPWLVKEANERIPPYCRQEKSTCMAYILGLSPGGVVGLHHYYLDRPVWGLVYTLTLGLCGVGWFLDWFRIWNLTRRANLVARGEATPGRKYTDDAYILWFPFGLIGLHHFYLGRHGWGCLYLFTLGLLGLGWLFDSCRLWALVRDYNSTLEETLRMLQSHTSQGLAEQGRTDATQTVIHVTGVAPGSYPGGSFHQYPPPAYTATPQQPLCHVTFSQPASYGSHNPVEGAAVAFLPTGGPRLETPPPNYESTVQEKPPRNPQ